MRRLLLLSACAATVTGIAIGCSSSSSDGGQSAGNDGGGNATDGATLGADGGSKGGDAGAAKDSGSKGAVDSGGSMGFAPSNFDPSTIDTSAIGDVSIPMSANCDIDTDAQTFSCDNQPAFAFGVKQITQSGGIAATVFAVKSLTIAEYAVVLVKGTRPLILYSLGAVTMTESNLIASASGNFPGGGAYPDGGPGEPLAPSGTFGAGGSSFCGLGGNGFALDGGAVITPGPAYGTVDLIPLVGGSAGAGHGNDGYGGGAIQITSLVSIDMNGLIEANGNGGEQGSTNAASPRGGGGGASGGAVLLEAPTVTLGGYSDIRANGGGGADGTAQGNQSFQGNHAGPAGLGGGAGSGGSFGIDYGEHPNGQPGRPDAGAYNYGGGGGGAGRIAIKTASGQADMTGILTPDLSTKCANVMKLTPK